MEGVSRQVQQLDRQERSRCLSSLCVTGLLILHLVTFAVLVMDIYLHLPSRIVTRTKMSDPIRVVLNTTDYINPNTSTTPSI